MATSKPTTNPTPQARLGSAIKTARDIMRKDAGLSGETDRIPQIAWLLFLKAFDDLEHEREIQEANHRPTIESPYRWRDWAGDPVEGRTGEELIEFVNGELLPHLRSLTGVGGRDPRDVLAQVFKETYNRMLSGYLLRDVIDKVNQVNFTSTDDIHTMAHVYESMLREMRDAAGDSGEFYTPRPVIRFMVQQVDPKIGETVLDPAVGTGGFLVESLEHMHAQANSVEDLHAIEDGLRGIEKKPLPYLLAMMNLLLHGLRQPNIVRGNALAEPLTQVKRSEQVDVIVTNPPFGGEEEESVQSNFPDATRSKETALLFLQVVQRRLKNGGRCAIVAPNGVLFADGVGARIKEKLLRECNLHTIVRLPPGVFAPYTSIPTNLLFFEKTGRTKEVWFYEHPLPEHQKNYTKTKPLRFDEFAECQRWWSGPSRSGREETEGAWRVAIGDLEQDWNLDRKSPNRPDELAHRPPQELVKELLETEQEILGLLHQVEAELRA